MTMRASVQPWGPSGWGIRRRSVLSAIVVVGLALFVGMAALLLLLQSTLVSTANDGLISRATDLATLLNSQGLVETQRAMTGTSQLEVSQVIDDAGTVVAASDASLRARPISNLAPAPGESATGTLTLPNRRDSDDYLVAARALVIGEHRFTVLVARPVQIQNDTIQTVALFLLAGVPLVLLLVGGAVWALVGRSLESVELIRRQVGVIDSQRLADRVEVPPTHDEVALLASTMNTMLERLQLSDQTLRSFLSDVGHELRSPLATVLTSAEIASSDPTGRTWIEMQPAILAEARRMQALVEDLLTLAKADAHVLIAKRVEVDVEDVLASEIQRLRTVTGHHIQLHLHPARIISDARRLAQVVRNVLDNAARHADSTIAITTRLNATEVIIFIDNDGAPIPEKDRLAVFKRFVRLDDSRDRDHGGSGLGLAISSEIIVMIGGTISADVTDQGWCRFTITLPLMKW